jgi:zinc protease
MIDRRIAPPVTLPESFFIPEARTEKLPGGNSITIVHAGEQEVVRIEFLFLAGSRYDAKKGESFFTSKMLYEGTKSFSALQIADLFDQYGAFYEVNHSSDYVNFTFYTLTRYFENIYPVIEEILLSPSFPEKELETLKSITGNNIRVNLNKTSYIASVKFRERIFNGHPYSKTLNEEDILAIRKEELVSFYEGKLFYNPVNVIVSGKPTEDIITSVAGLLKSIPSSKNGYVIQEDKVTPILSSDFIEKPDAVQCSLRFGCLTYPKKDSSHIDFLILNEILGGYFGSRLMKNIREEKGYTYGINSSVVNYLGYSYFVIGTDVGKEYTASTREEIYKEIEILKRKLVPEEELLTVKNYMKGGFLSSLNTPFSIADKYKSMLVHGLDMQFYHRYYNRLSAITSEDLIALANKSFPEKLTEVVVGSK